MDTQTVLQHVFGFIGICTVINWTHKFLRYKKRPKSLTLVCNHCGGDKWSLLRSMNIKKCIDCGREVEWKLDEGQLPLVANNRMVKRDERNR